MRVQAQPENATIAVAVRQYARDRGQAGSGLDHE